MTPLTKRVWQLRTLKKQLHPDLSPLIDNFLCTNYEATQKFVMIMMEYLYVHNIIQSLYIHVWGERIRCDHTH